MPPLWGFGGDSACAVTTERISKMSHRNTPSKTKVAPAKRPKKPAKLGKVASGSTRGGTKQETVVCTENLIRIDCVTESPKRQRR
jgi:hypothetical protein